MDFRVKTGYMVNLKSSIGTSPQVQQIGSKLFQNHGDRMPKTVWLFVDMAHLVMLLVKTTKVERALMKFWFEEAKEFLKGIVL